MLLFRNRSNIRRQVKRLQIILNKQPKRNTVSVLISNWSHIPVTWPHAQIACTRQDFSMTAFAGRGCYYCNLLLYGRGTEKDQGSWRLERKGPLGSNQSDAVTLAFSNWWYSAGLFLRLPTLNVPSFLHLYPTGCICWPWLLLQYNYI